MVVERWKVFEAIIKICVNAIVLIAVAGYLTEKGVGMEMFAVYGLFMSYLASQVLDIHEELRKK